MNTNMIGHDQAHLMGESATHPIEPPWRVLAALLLLADTNQRRRHTLPAHPMAAHPGASNCRF